MSGSCNNTAGVDFSEDILKHASLPFGKVTVLLVQGKIALSFLFLLTFCGFFLSSNKSGPVSWLCLGLNSFKSNSSKVFKLALPAMDMFLVVLDVQGPQGKLCYLATVSRRCLMQVAIIYAGMPCSMLVQL